ncbi:hypothetical protein ACFFX1_05090 [Dactylosporangium sucinum]|uniref:Uncharacterized protein n=1 Tax=Dactylosporangium sucinum TaxID=1424081 RepID=A0A917WVH8_9ACTN|nr:hypothetical protein [Dactylosporangium sucinum]GGM32662.1 hypothetical protein GCM10007977_037560 [Dactylosporangium sucinum]
MTTKRKGPPRPSPASRGAGTRRPAATNGAGETDQAPGLNHPGKIDQAPGLNRVDEVDQAAESTGAGGVHEPERAAGATVTGGRGAAGGPGGADSAGRVDKTGGADVAGPDREAGRERPGDVAADGAAASGAGASEAGQEDVAQDSAVEVVLDGAVAEPVRRMSPELERRLNLWITVGGLVVVTLLALVLALIEAFFAPFRLHGTGARIPISLVLAVVTNPLLGWFAFTTTGRRLAALLPAGAWCAVWILAAGRTTEGDLLLTDGNWVGLLTLFAGPLAFAVGIYVSALRQRPANSKPGALAPRSVDG